MKIKNLNELEANRDWFGVKSKVEANILDPLPRDGDDCPGGGMALLYFTMEPEETFPEHGHPNSRIIIIWRGSGLVRVDDAEFPVKQFDCFNLPPRIRHTFKSGPNGLVIFSVHSTSIDPDDEKFFFT
jgi:quercetin dioxygenase-like cupin family protein